MSNQNPEPPHPEEEAPGEEFDFGEGGDNEKMFPPPKPPQNKPALLGVIAILLVFLMGYLGYRFFAKKPQTSAQSSAVPTLKAIPSEVANATPPSPGLAEGLPTPPPRPTSPAPSPGTPSGLPQPPGATAFKEGDIQELQKELFGTPPVVPAPTKAPVAADAAPKTTGEDTEKVNKALETVSKLNDQIENNLGKIKELDTSIQALSQILQRLTSQLASMDSQISTLSTTTANLSKDVTRVQGELGQVRRALGEEGLDLSVSPRRHRVSETKLEIEEPEYVVHAVIPGRAWLRSSGGQIVTVTEGDKLGNYGKVLVIDATNGVVLTSSGITFR